MKTKLFVIGIAIGLVMCLMHSCNQDDAPQPVEKGEVAFGFSAVADDQVAGLKSTEALEDAVSVIVTIMDIGGNEVYSQKQLPLINMNGSFITQPISLLVGEYSLTEFIVVDENGDALYIAPLEGSPKAYLVNDPLPIEFSVSKDDVLKLVPEVLSTDNAVPEDFGYTTFSFEVVETFDFLLAVFVYNDLIANYELTTASLTVEADGAVIYTGMVEAITDTVTLNDGYFEYIVTVEKEGYSTYVDTFSNAELKLYYRSEDNGPLIVVLESDQTGPFACGDSLTDSRNGVSYPTVQIGDQCWMASNLNIGDMIDATIAQSDNSILEKYCYNNDLDICFAEGGLYTWYEMMDYNEPDTIYPGSAYHTTPFIKNTQGICPLGWHLPTLYEWDVLKAHEDLDFFNFQYSGAMGVGGYFENLGTATLYFTTGIRSDNGDQGSGLIGDPINIWNDGVSYWTFGTLESLSGGLSVRCIKNEI